MATTVALLASTYLIILTKLIGLILFLTWLPCHRQVLLHKCLKFTHVALIVRMKILKRVMLKNYTCCIVRVKILKIVIDQKFSLTILISASNHIQCIEL